MAKPLVIVESPAKAKTIEKFLGRRYKVKASVGHVRDLPKSQLGVDVDNGFEPKYITIRGKGDTIKELRQSAKKAGRVLLATDPDREGEAISWHLAHVLGIDSSEPCRIEFNEITRDAVTRAIKNPRPINLNLVDAQQARRVLDRLVGYNLSPLLWRKVKKGLSAGRVQSVAVRLICDREDEINAFVPEEYWTLGAHLLAGRESFVADYVGVGGKKTRIDNQAAVKKLVAALEGKPYRVEEVTKRQRQRSAPAPFTTSSLQQEAFRRLGFTVRRTMRVAQELYEGLDIGKEGTVGLITYPRTDSMRIAEEAQKEAREYIAENFGKEYSAQYRAKKAAPGSQEAHEAIRPTSTVRTPDSLKPYLGRDQLRLYRLIWERFLASQMTKAVFDTVSVKISAGEHLFRASGSVLKFPGFMAVYVEGRDDNEEEEGTLPELEKGQELKLKKLEPKQHFTQPPPRYTEAMLVKTLEELGIGRPSTYAPIIETIQQRGYVVKEDKRFVPTELGKVVVDLLKEHFRDIIDVEFTAKMEDRLDRIEEGKDDWKQLLREFYRPFSQTLAKAEEQIGEVEVPEEETDVVCEKCGRNMVIKFGRYGKFLACPGFPECRNTKPYVESIGVACPKCGGDLVERRSKKGRRFFGCSNYPECDFVSWQKPVDKKCPECGSIMVEKTSGGRRYLACSQRECGYREKEASD